MKKRLLSIFIIFLALLIVVPSLSYSLFVFSSLTSSNDSSITLGGVDNIQENYQSEANSDDTSTEYTIYFYPSTLYTQQYANYLGKSSNNFITNNSSYLPEDMFGYVDITYEEVQGQYQTNEKVITSKNPLTWPNTSSSASNGDQYYLNYIAEQNVSNSIYKETETYLQTLITEENIYTIDPYNYVWNNPKDGNENSDNGSPFYLNYDYSYGSSNPNDDVSLESRTGKRAKFRNDRFGYWPELYSGEGRYLPYKITITDNFPLALYEKLNLTPYNDMGDDSDGGYTNSWYNLEFSAWGYFNNNNEFSCLPREDYNYLLGSYYASDVLHVFDIMRNLEEYAKEENGEKVIRLFPIFSNGKNYSSQKDEEEMKEMFNFTEYDTKKYTADNYSANGGRDAIKISFGYKDNKNEKTYYKKDQYFLYNEESIENGNMSGLPIKFASINNLNIDTSNLESIVVSGASIGKSYGGGLGPGNWTGKWVDMVTIFDSNNKDLLDKYGDGLFNLYCFVVSPNAYQTVTRDYGPRYIIKNINDGSYFRNSGEKMMNYVVSSLSSVPSLKNKHLDFLVSSPRSIDNNTTEGEGFQDSYFIFAVEKVTEAKFVAGLDVDNETNINDQVDRLYNMAPSMVKQTHNVYEAKSEVIHTQLDNEAHHVITEINNTQIQNEEPLENENIYIIKNVDFTNYTSIEYAAFQIRLYSKYQGSAVHFYTSNLGDKSHTTFDKFEGDNYLDYLDNNGNNTIFYDMNNDGIIDNNEVYLNASYYFDLYNAHDSINSTGRYYLPKSSQYLGLYDFILYAHEEPLEHDVTNTSIHYHLYAFRHSNVFVKLVDVSSYDEFFNDSYGFLKHNSLKNLWEKRYYIGTTINKNDVSDSNDTLTLEESLKNSNNIIKDGRSYSLIDYVSGLSVGIYALNDDGKYHLTITEQFRIRKNYILYLKENT